MYKINPVHILVAIVFTTALVMIAGTVLIITGHNEGFHTLIMIALPVITTLLTLKQAIIYKMIKSNNGRIEELEKEQKRQHKHHAGNP